MGNAFSNIDFSALLALQSLSFSLSPSDDGATPLPTPSPTPRPTSSPTQRPTSLPVLSVDDDKIVSVQRTCMTSPGDVNATNFNICLDLNVTESTVPFFFAAAETWERVNVGDQPSYSDENFYGPFSPQFLNNPEIFIKLKPTYIDDLYISAREIKMDGVGGRLGSAGPRFVNRLGIPVVGVMEFDEDDIRSIKKNNQRLLQNTITHEMAHVQGIGTLVSDCDDVRGTNIGTLLNNSCLNQWQSNGLFDPVTGTYSGSEANRVWTETCGGTSIPIQVVKSNGQAIQNPLNEAEYDGSVFTHWDEKCMGDELMSPLLSPGAENYLSEVTVAGLADLGWSVDYSQAASFVPPSAQSGCRVACVPKNRRLRGAKERDLSSTEDMNLDDGDYLDRLSEIVLSNEKFIVAAKSAFDIMSKARSSPPDYTPDGLTYVGGEVTTIFMVDEDDNIRDVTFRWQDVKDMDFN